MRRRLSTYWNRSSVSSPPPTSQLKDVPNNDNNNLNSVPVENETVLEEVCFDTKMAFDQVSSPALAYTFAKADFDPNECK